MFFNNKGGVGKTTLACNVVAYISEHYSKRVLLVDADPQCNATQALLDDELCEQIYLTGKSKQKTIYDILKPLELGEPGIADKIAPAPRSKNRYKTDLIPGHPSLSTMEDRLSEAWSKLLAGEIPGFRISNWAEQLMLSFEDDYDLIVFDVGPSLGALNRTIILASDFIVAPFGCDIFSILGINNIGTWIKKWQEDYEQSLLIAKRKDRLSSISEFNCIQDTSSKFRLAGYSVQQYVSRKFKEGPRPVKAYDRIMKDIPTVVEDRLSFITPEQFTQEQLRLGDVPYVYSLVPLSQSNKTPIHSLTGKEGLVGSQYKQVTQYAELMKQVSDRLIKNVGV